MDATTSRVKTQTVVFVRHGIAQHNIIQPDGTKPDLRDPNLFDPPLVRDGKFQALDAGERLRMWWKMTQGGKQIELAIASPLTRCLQTASLAFLPGDEYCKSGKEPTIVCLEQIREAFGMHFPDRRRRKSLLAVCIYFCF
jgi:broad specificity phosphatase PhoE